MTQKFDCFVVFAEMRTGSNFLEANINAYTGLKCWGEIYNPAFIGESKCTELAGISMSEREKDPMGLLTRLQERTDGLAGFRYFHDHDPRMLEPLLQNPRCAKIVLTRNPLESYVSLKIASKTNVWVIQEMKDARDDKIEFVSHEFSRILAETKAFQLRLQNELQRRGQTAFYLSYEDTRDVDVLNGLASFLGQCEPRTQTVQKTKVQNPAELEDKVSNLSEMKDYLSSIDYFNLSDTPNFEPRKGPSVPAFVGASGASLLYMPVRGTPSFEVGLWLQSLEGKSDLVRNFNQKTLRSWKRNHKGHRSFTVISHPVARLHRVFCKYVVGTTEDVLSDVREQLCAKYGIPLPDLGETFSLSAHRDAFIKFAQFVQGNLNAQTSIRVDKLWASQTEILKGFAEFGVPDLVLRENEIEKNLKYLIQKGKYKEISFPTIEPDGPYSLGQVYNQDVEDAVRAAYQKDYMMFGFRPWGK